MPPIPQLSKLIDETIKENEVVIFSKTTCPFCQKVKALFDTLNVKYFALEINTREDGPGIQDALFDKTGQKTVPNVFIRSEHIGGHDDVVKLHSSGDLIKKSKPHSFDFDLIVIGGGSGGLAASKEAANLGAKVAVLDFVEPTPKGTTWGLGGTCVNVGCIPKKLMHQAALLGHSIDESRHFGWQVPEKVDHDWKTMVDGVGAHIGSLNWGYRVALRDKNVTYKNSFGTLEDAHTVLMTDRSGKQERVTTNSLILATGERPRYPGIPGDKEFGITSDDLFSLPHAPGKTLVVGASYVALECAGFLAGLGYNVTVMVRSIFLRGFDQQMANKIGEFMENHDVNFIRECVPTKIEKLEDGAPGLLQVHAVYNDKTEFKDKFNTVIFAIGRDPCTSKLGLDKAGVTLDKAGRVICDETDRSNVHNIYAIGDISSGKPQLTPVAIQAGRTLARRLYTGSKELMDYTNVATTVFTPLEYGCIGLSEEDAIAKHGEDNIEVYHSSYKPLEWTVPHKEDNACYAKLACLKPDERVVGLHILGPNAGEMTQGFALGMKLGACKRDFDSTVGIHPTCAENLVTLDISKSSGKDAAATGC